MVHAASQEIGRQFRPPTPRVTVGVRFDANPHFCRLLLPLTVSNLSRRERSLWDNRLLKAALRSQLRWRRLLAVGQPDIHDRRAMLCPLFRQEL
jgi:hypothetical protein